MVTSYWSIPKEVTLRTPAGILNEQASALTEQTGGQLVGKVEQEPGTNYLNLYLDIIVPSLNNYRFRLLRYLQPTLLYPGRIMPSVRENTVYKVGDDAEFESALKEILSSPDVVRVITALLAQVRQA